MHTLAEVSLGAVRQIESISIIDSVASWRNRCSNYNKVLIQNWVSAIISAIKGLTLKNKIKQLLDAAER